MSDEDVVARSDRLNEEIAGSAAIHDLTQASRRQRLFIRILSISIAFDLLLSAGFGWVAFRAQQTANQARSVEDRAYTACLAGNETRAQERQLWSYVLGLTTATQQTPEQLQMRADFQAYIARLYAPRRCVP